jgi:SWI/SNF-related matrix-associated actin-dependent regulator 1 of chromatin subfamily A
MPQHTPGVVQTAWLHANGDVKKATELLSDPHWDHTPSVSKPEVEDVGRVKEIEEASKAERAAVKEKGKKSMIYANRSVLDNKAQRVTTPPPFKPVIDPSSSPISPVVAPRRRKRIKKMVFESEPELELTDSDDQRVQVRRRQDSSDQVKALDYFNTTGPEALQELTGTLLSCHSLIFFPNYTFIGCTPAQAKTIIERRPFESTDDLNTKLGQGKKKAGPAGLSPRIFEDCTAIFKEYGAVDSILEDCEKIGATLRTAIASWTSTSTSGAVKIKNDCLISPVLDEVEDGALSLRSLTSLQEQKSKGYLVTQPSLLSDSVQLKDYQLVGVNWLQLLYRSNFSCILADEMGMYLNYHDLFMLIPNPYQVLAKLFR